MSLDPIHEKLQSYIGLSEVKGREREIEKEGVEQEMREWRGEDKQLRKYRWITPEPHESLRKTVDTLSPVSESTSPFS